MYTDYKEKCSKITFQPVSYDKYAKVVLSMNISFAKLGDERCEECEAHKLHLKENEEEYSEEMDEEESCSKVLKEKRRKINLPENTVCRNNDCVECRRFLLHKVKKKSSKRGLP